MSELRIVVADQQHLVRKMLCRELESMGDIVVVAQADSVRNAVDYARHYRPDVVLVSTSLTGGGGFHACRQIVEADQGAAVLVLSGATQDVQLARAWMAGAAGFLDMSMDPKIIGQSLRQAAESGTIYSPDQLSRIRTWRQEVGAKLRMLTRREYDVLQLVAMGCTNSEIASDLSISAKTVECHVGRLLSKFDVTSRRAIVTWLRNTNGLAALFEERSNENQGFPPMSPRWWAATIGS